MNKRLAVRLERLETRVVPTWTPLRVVCPLHPPKPELAPGERIVQDEFVDGDERYPLVITVHERITTDPNDHGRSWSQGAAQ